MMDTHFILRQALSLKIAEFKDNPKAHVLIGYDETNNRSFLEIDANVEILKDQETIDWIWNKQDKSFLTLRMIQTCV